MQGSAADRSKVRLLIVDDEEPFAVSVRRYLSQHDFECTIASSGALALEWLDRATFDILMLDIRMPNMDGFELCRHIRDKSNAPIIMCSGVASGPERTFALEIGADDCLVKPVDPRELLARLRAVLRRTKGTTAGERLEIGGMIIDRATRSVSVGGEARPLTTHEFDLLWVLAKAGGKVLNREEILDALHGADSAFDRSVDVHISKIRQKLGADAGRCIRTVRGIGYALDARFMTGAVISRE
jgi:DNA-binding response OmpR family regulator